MSACSRCGATRPKMSCHVCGPQVCESDDAGPYTNGHDAGLLRIHNNPYPEGTEEHQDWLDGYHDGFWDGVRENQQPSKP